MGIHCLLFYWEFDILAGYSEGQRAAAPAISQLTQLGAKFSTSAIATSPRFGDCELCPRPRIEDAIKPDAGGLRWLSTVALLPIN